MGKHIAYAGAFALATLVAAPALAAIAVSFVSVTGDDTRNCAAPATSCRTFQRAHDATSAHGEIIALTPGDYRPVSITKSISITGVEGAGILQTGRVFVTPSAVTSSGIGLNGDFTSAGDNLIRGNVANVQGKVTTIGRQ